MSTELGIKFSSSIVTETERIKDQLGRPYFETENCLIYQGDCLELMRRLDDGLLNLTITSPPYNIGKEYEKPLALTSYIQWSQEWIQEVHRLSKPHGAFWLNMGYLEVPTKGKAVPIAYLLWDKTSFYLIQEVIWNYGAGVAGKRFLSPRNEKLLWYVKDEDNYTFNLDAIRDKDVKYPNQKKNGKLKCNPLGKNPTDVWQIAKVTSGQNRSSQERTPHPCQFPEKLVDRVIKASTNEGEIVMDPFLGSGTAGVVALANSRKFIGFEIDERYCEMAAQRIEDFLKFQKQGALFGVV